MSVSGLISLGARAVRTDTTGLGVQLEGRVGDVLDGVVGRAALEDGIVVDRVLAVVGDSHELEGDMPDRLVLLRL